MGEKQFWAITLSGAFVFLFVFTLKAEAFNLFSYKTERNNDYFQRQLRKLCDVREKVHEKFPRFPVPRICRTKNIKPPTLEFYAEPQSIEKGQSSTLHWASDNTLSCEASGGWRGEKNLSGEKEILPKKTKTYTLTCDGVEDGIEKSVVVTVTQPLPPPPPPPPEEPTDVCPNLDGVQEIIPVGFHLDNGQCIVDEPPVLQENVVINEIAWMGSVIDGSANANAEWIELRNLGNQNVNLSGWTLAAADGTPNVSVSSSCANTIIPASGFFMLVRTNSSVLGVNADCVYTGALGNDGEMLELKNSANPQTSVDTINGLPGWQIGGGLQKGDNTTKETAQRTDDGTWFTSAPTPGSSNIINPI
jgi:hypothetical protein